jgi:hypothetical protein
VTQNWWGEALIRTELVRKATKLLSPAKSFRRCRSLAPPSNGPVNAVTVFPALWEI